jgi:hypothetical protein
MPRPRIDDGEGSDSCRRNHVSEIAEGVPAAAELGLHAAGGAVLRVRVRFWAETWVAYLCRRLGSL